jgi:hypothetical protein
MVNGMNVNKITPITQPLNDNSNEPHVKMTVNEKDLIYVAHSSLNDSNVQVVIFLAISPMITIPTIEGILM